MKEGPAAAVFAAIDSLLGTVMMARLLAQSGRAIDLAGLDAEAAALCAMVAGLPREAGRQLRPALQALVREVESLATTLPGPPARQ